MKIPIIYIPRTRFKKYVMIEKRFKCKQEIVPIGCDCHPAYTLQKLHIRKQSLPFDWLNTDSIKGLGFVSKNVKTDFRYFLKGLQKNARGHVVSSEYPYAEFMHEQNLIDSKGDRKKIRRRIDRFQRLRSSDCYYLYNITSSSLDSENDVHKFYKSVVEFKTLLKGNQLLCIYIRYDEHLKENENNCELLLKLLKGLGYVRTANYIREKSKEGIWGNTKKYPALYTALGIDLSISFPKIYISSSRYLSLS